MWNVLAVLPSSSVNPFRRTLFVLVYTSVVSPGTTSETSEALQWHTSPAVVMLLARVWSVFACVCASPTVCVFGVCASVRKLAQPLKDPHSWSVLVRSSVRNLGILRADSLISDLEKTGYYQRENLPK